MVNYGNGLIYKLCCKNTNIKDEYIGSTTDFTERKRTHKKRCNNTNSKSYNTKVYKFIRDNGGFCNWSMILVEKYPCNDKLELTKRERHFIELFESKLNCQIPTRTHKEYRVENADKLKEYRVENADKIKERGKEWRVKNADKIKEKSKVWYEEHNEEIKEKAKEYNLKNADKIKEYKKVWYEEHKEERKEKSKEYRSKNADSIKERDKKYYEQHKEEKKEKITCECGTEVSSGYLTEHRKTDKHKKLLEQILP